MLVATLILLLFGSAVWAQDLTGDLNGGAALLFRLEKDVASNRVRFKRPVGTKPQQAAELRAVLTESGMHLKLLREKSTNRTVSGEYAQSITEDFAVIEKISGRREVGSTEWEQIKAVNADLRVKAEHAEILPEAAFDAIEVIVRTKKNGEELSNYQVWYVKEAFKNDTAKYQTFDRFSSPSSRKLPPGRYVMWSQATDGSKAVGEKTPKEFGDGQAKVEIDLAAP